MAKQRRRSSDDDLIALVGEYSERRTYRPGKEVPLPDEVPADPSGTAVSTDKNADGPDPAAAAGDAAPDTSR